jgi:hypothetical protein
VLEFPLPASSSFNSFASFFLAISFCFFVYSLQSEVSIRNLKLSSSIAVVFQASKTELVFYQLSSSIDSCTSGLLRLQLSSADFQVQLLAVLQEFLGFNGIIPVFQVQL